MRQINKIIIHCSASERAEDDNFDRLVEFHTSPPTKLFQWGEYEARGRGWRDVGYHFFITKDGTLHWGRPLDQIGAHCYGHNKDSIGICFSGNGSLSENQKRTAKIVLGDLIYQFGLTTKNILPHNHFNRAKTCPGFDVAELL